MIDRFAGKTSTNANTSPVRDHWLVSDFGDLQGRDEPAGGGRDSFLRDPADSGEEAERLPAREVVEERVGLRAVPQTLVRLQHTAGCHCSVYGPLSLDKHLLCSNNNITSLYEFTKLSLPRGSPKSK